MHPSYIQGSFLFLTNILFLFNDANIHSIIIIIDGI